jgi:hypothetical protein
MDSLDIVGVRIGNVRVGGLIGHAMHVSGRFLGRMLGSRRLWAFVAFTAMAGGFGAAGYAGITRYLDYKHALELLSPIQKETYVVEDTHDAGKYMVVRRDTLHLKLQCEGGKEKDDKGEWQTLGSWQCYEFKPGDSIRLERWDQGEWTSVVYVYKMKQGEGEYDYAAFRDHDGN